LRFGWMDATGTNRFLKCTKREIVCDAMMLREVIVYLSSAD